MAVAKFVVQLLIFYSPMKGLSGHVVRMVFQNAFHEDKRLVKSFFATELDRFAQEDDQAFLFFVGESGSSVWFRRSRLGKRCLLATKVKAHVKENQKKGD